MILHSTPQQSHFASGTFLGVLPWPLCFELPVCRCDQEGGPVFCGRRVLVDAIRGFCNPLFRAS